MGRVYSNKCVEQQAGNTDYNRPRKIKRELFAKTFLNITL